MFRKPLSLTALANSVPDVRPYNDPSQAVFLVEDLLAEVASHEMTMATVQRLVAALPGRERRVIRLRFGLGCKRTYRQREVAARMDLSERSVRNIEKRALARLRYEWPTSP